MKNTKLRTILISTATAATLSSSFAMATVGGNGVFGETAFINEKQPVPFASISQNNQSETTIAGTFKTIDGVFVGAQSTYDWSSSSKGIKATTFGAGYRYNVSENFYLMPQATYTFQDREGDYSYQNPFTPATLEAENNRWDDPSYNKGDAWELGLQAGYYLDSGVFFAARYGYEKSKDSFSITEMVLTPEQLHAQTGFDKKVAIQNVELTMGYQIADVVTLSASWMQHKFSDVNGYYDSGNPEVNPLASGTAKFNGKSTDYELKATFTSFGQLVPYMSYTNIGDQTLKMDHAVVDVKGKASNEFEIGMSLAF
ncbi:MAG: DUF2860 domain-containing protein [Colwellia sp.]|nr:DUF2860 domain-containing protein [Colwellia sp.]